MPRTCVVTPNFLQITPFMHVPALDRALAFFTDVLGFRVVVRMGDYAYIDREGVGIRLLQNHGEQGAPPGNRRFAYYIDVRDVDALYADLKPKLDTLPPGDVRGPEDKIYGQRELLVLAPDGNLLAFGQSIGGDHKSAYEEGRRDAAQSDRSGAARQILWALATGVTAELTSLQKVGYHPPSDETARAEYDRGWRDELGQK